MVTSSSEERVYREACVGFDAPLNEKSNNENLFPFPDFNNLLDTFVIHNSFHSTDKKNYS